MRNFDFIFSNPPYNKNLDLKILANLFQCAKKIVFVQPAGYILDKKFQSSTYNKVREVPYLKYINLFWGNIMFGVKVYMPLCISQWDMNKNNNICKVDDDAITNTSYDTTIKEVSIHGKSMQSIISFIKEYMEKHAGNLYDHLTAEENLTDYSAKFSLIRGHAMELDGWNDDIFTLICMDYHDNYCDHTFRFGDHVSTKLHWSFHSEEERYNFIIYCKSKVVRFLLSLLKNAQHLDSGELNFIPWMDFSKRWDDSALCKEFKIDKDMWKYINSFIADYYKDYVSGF